MSNKKKRLARTDQENSSCYTIALPKKLGGKPKRRNPPHTASPPPEYNGPRGVR